MFKKLVPLIVLLVVLLLGGFYYLTMEKPSPEADTPNMPQTADTSDTTEEAPTFSDKVTGTLSEIVAMGKSYKCDFNYSDSDGAATTGTLYIAEKGKKMSGDFELRQADGTVVTSNILSDGKFNYIWSSDIPNGYKVAIPEDEDPTQLFEESSSVSGSSSNLEVFDEAAADYDCTVWIVDEAKFIPPQDIEFVDFTQSLEMFTEDESSTQEDKCSTCDMVTDESYKLQCLEALGCN